MEKSRRLWGSKPRLVVLRLINVRAKRPAPTKRSMESATWKTTMDLPARPLRRRVTEEAASLSAVLTSVRVACHAGARPKRMPVRMETVAVKAKMRRSKRVLRGEGRQARRAGGFRSILGGGRGSGWLQGRGERTSPAGERRSGRAEGWQGWRRRAGERSL